MISRRALWCGAVFAVFIVLSAANIVTRIPFCDESWLASAPRNLLVKGYMGTSYVETAGTSAQQIDRYTYWVMPLYPVVQAIWYKIIGFGLVQTRLTSLAWGLVAIWAWMSVIQKIHGSYTAAVLTGFLIACDYFFVGSSAAGRMDMMSAALAFLGWAVYLNQRESHLSRAILLSHFCAAAALFTHPNALGEVLCLLVLTFSLDRRLLRIRHLGIAAVPYFVMAAGWAIYISENPAAWRSQLISNARAGGHGSWALFPYLRAELLERYLGLYGFREGTSLAAHVAILIVVFYAIAAIALKAWPALRRQRGTGLLFNLIFVMAGALALLEPKKYALYWVHAVPGYDAALAILLVFCWSLAGRFRMFAALVTVTVFILQLGANFRTIHTNSYQSLYVPAVQFLRSHSDAKTTIIGNAELAFGLGFPETLHDDRRLGFLSGIQPEVIVVDKDYKTYFEGFRVKDPAVYNNIKKQLSRCNPEFQSEAFTIYTGCSAGQLKPALAPGPV